MLKLKSEQSNMNKIFNYLILTILLIPSASFATVGGPESIEILGTDITDQKIYFLRHYEDESGRLPKLYYFQLNTSTDKAVEVKSLYTNLSSKNYDIESEKTLDEISKIQKRLKPLTPLSNKNSELILINKATSLGNYWLNVPEAKASRETIHYQIKNVWNKKTYTSDLSTIISYQNKPIQITHIYQTPLKMQLAQLAVVKYLGIPTETGYTKEDVVLLRPNK